MDSGFATSVTQEQLRNILTNSAPVAEGNAPIAGTGTLASRDDHMHPRLSSATVGTLDSNALATVTFTRSFTTTPCVQCLLVETADAQPVVFKVESWVMTGPFYTGCVLRGYRSSVLPALSGILLIGPLISSLASYNIFGGSAANAQFCCLAIQPSN